MVEDSIDAALRRQPRALQGKRLALLVSGGADSMCLLMAVARWRASSHSDEPPIVFHLDHGLRIESAEDADFVRVHAHKLGFDSRIERIDLNSERRPGESLEAAGRRKRYQCFALWANESRAGVLVSAHHRRDHRESTALQIIRGSDYRGWKGIPRLRPVSFCDPLLLWRPFLHLEPEALRNDLRRRGHIWRDDASNQDPSFLRNRVRHEILNHTSSAQDQFLERVARFSADLERKLRSLIPEVLERCRYRYETPRRRSIDAALIQDYPGELGVLVLEWMESALGVVNPHVPSRLVVQMQRRTSGGVQTPAGTHFKLKVDLEGRRRIELSR